ncbi:F-box protein At4g00755 [Linum grandiflorum]
MSKDLGMENCLDFFNWLDYDALMYIFMFLDDPADLVRASSVSRTWRHFVVKNGLCKLLCMRRFPAFRKLQSVIEPSRCVKDTAEVGCSGSGEDDGNLGVEHRALAFLAHSCSSFPVRECIGEAISASSTDNYPEESVRNTLEPLDRVASKGQSSDAVPENLVYKLASGICVVTEINIKPFQAYFQWGSPIYSPKSVRFRLGHSSSPMDDPTGELCNSCSDQKMVWTYTSPEFPMTQENRLQKFTLPEPVMCVNGMLMVELLGRTQKQAMDGLFYICICNVQVMGRPLSPAFGVDIVEPSGGFNLKVLSYEPTLPEQLSPNEYLQGRIRDLEQILNLLRDQGVVVEDYDWHGEEEEEDDAEFEEEFAL